MKKSPNDIINSYFYFHRNVFNSVLFSRLGIASIPLIVTTFKPWGFMNPKIGVSDAILQVYQLILPLLLILLILKLHYLVKSTLRRLLLISGKN